jgi:hypothetical protein
VGMVDVSEGMGVKVGTGALVGMVGGLGEGVCQVGRSAHGRCSGQGRGGNDGGGPLWEGKNSQLAQSCDAAVTPRGIAPMKHFPQSARFVRSMKLDDGAECS